MVNTTASAWPNYASFHPHSRIPKLPIGPLGGLSMSPSGIISMSGHQMSGNLASPFSCSASRFPKQLFVFSCSQCHLWRSVSPHAWLQCRHRLFSSPVSQPFDSHRPYWFYGSSFWLFWQNTFYFTMVYSKNYKHKDVLEIEVLKILITILQLQLSFPEMIKWMSKISSLRYPSPGYLLVSPCFSGFATFLLGCSPEFTPLLITLSHFLCSLTLDFLLLVPCLLQPVHLTVLLPPRRQKTRTLCWLDSNLSDVSECWPCQYYLTVLPLIAVLAPDRYSVPWLCLHYAFVNYLGMPLKWLFSAT